MCRSPSDSRPRSAIIGICGVPTCGAQDDGQPLTRQMVQYRVLRARAGRSCRRRVHILRHKFLFAPGDARSAAKSDSESFGDILETGRVSGQT